MSATLPAPVPARSPETEEFWAATARGVLLLRRCDDCGTVIWYPRPFCPSCGGFSTSWTEASGRGTVYSFTVVRRSAMEGWRDALPYVVAYVELEEGPRVMTNIVECEPAEVSVSMAVEVVFHDTGQDSAVFRFRPAPS